MTLKIVYVIRILFHNLYYVFSNEDTPEIEIPKRRVHGGLGYKAELTCKIIADPPAQVKIA